MSKPQQPALPLSSLLLRLEREGFVLGVDKHLHLQILLRELADEYRDDPQNLGRLIGPVLAKSQEEQEKFQRIFEAYYREEVIPYLNLETDGPPAPPGPREPETVRRPDRISRWITPFIALLSLALFAGILLLDIAGPQAPLHPRFVIQLDSTYRGIGDVIAFSAGDTVVFLNRSTELRKKRSIETQGIEYIWDFGDGSQRIITQSEKSVSHVYTEPGHYYVSLAAGRTDGTADSTVSRVVEIYCPDEIFLEYSFFFDGNAPTVDDYIRFQSDIAGLSSAGLSFQWDFDDGNTATEPAPSHQFEEPGNYVVTLTVMRVDTLPMACSNFATFSRTIPISRPEESVLIDRRIPQEDAEPEEEMALTVFAIVALSFLAALCLLGGLLVLMQYRKRDYSPRSPEKFNPGDQEPFEIPYPNQDALISPDQDLYTLAATMRRRQAGEIRKIDLKSTIRETIEAVGMPRLAYDTASKPSEYLILIEQPHVESHQTHLFARIVEILKGEDVLLETYFFDGDIRVCWNEDKPDGISLGQLRQLYPRRRLLVYGNGHHFIDPYEARLLDWVPEALAPWKGSSLLLTPASVADWGYRERLLREIFSILPVDIQGQLAMVDKFNSQELPDYDALRKDLQELIPESRERISGYDFDQIDDLRLYLGEELFEWVAATAVYPWPVWEMTLAIGKALSDQAYTSESYLLTYSNLLRIARIPWMHDDQLPPKLRFDLLQSLRPEIEGIAREAVLDMLRQVRVQPDSLVHRKIAVQETTHQFFLTPGDEEIAREMHYLLQNQQITDRVALQKMDANTDQFDGESPRKHLRKRFAPVKPLEIALAALLGVILTALLGYYLHDRYDRTPELKQWARYLQVDSTPLVRYIPQIDSAIYFNNAGVQAYWDSADKVIAIGLFETATMFREDDYQLPYYNLAVVGYNEGVELYSNGRYELAIADFERVLLDIEDATDSMTLDLKPDVLHGIGLCHFHLGDESAARLRMAEIQVLDSSYFGRIRPNLLELLDAREADFQRYISQSDSSLQKRAYALAISYADSALLIKPDDPEAIRLREEASTALANAPVTEQVRSILRVGNQLFDKEQYEKAKVQYEEALALAKTDVQANKEYSPEIQDRIDRCDQYLTGSSSALYFYENLDAAADFGNGKVYLFRGSRCIRYDKASGKKDPNFPMPISEALPGLPIRYHSDLDAVMNIDNTSIFFIKGPYMIRYNWRNKSNSGDRLMVNQVGNWPGTLSNQVDAATNWDNGKFYFMQGAQYIAFQADQNRALPDYPKANKGNWRGLPDSWHQQFDAAFFSANQKKCYIFHGNEYAVYDSPTDQLVPGYPRSMGRSFVNDLGRVFASLPTGPEQTQAPPETEENQIPVSKAVAIQDGRLTGQNLETALLPNYTQRPGSPESIILNYTVTSDAQGVIAYTWDINKKQNIGFHLVIDRDGSITQLLNFDTYTNGLGRSSYGKKSGSTLSQESIVIELVNLGWLRQGKTGYETALGQTYEGELYTQSFRGYDYWQPYTRAQLTALEDVCKLLVAKYGITEIIERSTIDPRKSAPGPAFPIEQFRAEVLAAAPATGEVPLDQEEVYKVVETMPFYKSPACEDIANTAERKKCADAKMFEFIYGRQIYPPIARENGVEGTCVVQFIVDRTGRVRNPKIVRDIGGGCGKEAQRLVELMQGEPTWEPGLLRGRPVNVSYNLPIKFILE